MLKNLLAFVLAYLSIGVDPPGTPEPTPPPSSAAADDPDDAGDDDLPDLDAPDDPDDAGDDAPDPNDHQTLLRAATARAEKAEREAREERDRREALERSRGGEPPARAAPNQDQQLHEQEEARLRDPAVTPQERWQIESNRTLRASRRAAEEALWQSREAADRSAFERLCSEKPLAKKYSQRVDEKLAEMRKQGYNLERKLVLKMIIGDDIVEGKVSTKRKPAAAAPAKPGVARGAPAHARGDVRGRGVGNTEAAKRKARLENQLI